MRQYFIVWENDIIRGLLVWGNLLGSFGDLWADFNMD